MIRGLNYHLTDETFPFEFNDFVKQVDGNQYRDTPNRGFYNRMLTDSDIERKFALGADLDDEVVCFMKLPTYYKIPTPIGNYNPDFGIVMKRKSLRNGKESEIYKIECAVKHFATLGVEVQYKAPVKDYQYFKTEATKDINALIEEA